MPPIRQKKFTEAEAKKRKREKNRRYIKKKRLTERAEQLAAARGAASSESDEDFGHVSDNDYDANDIQERLVFNLNQDPNHPGPVLLHDREIIPSQSDADEAEAADDHLLSDSSEARVSNGSGEGLSGISDDDVVAAPEGNDDDVVPGSSDEEDASDESSETSDEEPLIPSNPIPYFLSEEANAAIPEEDKLKELVTAVSAVKARCNASDSSFEKFWKVRAPWKAINFNTLNFLKKESTTNWVVFLSYFPS